MKRTTMKLAIQWLMVTTLVSSLSLGAMSPDTERELRRLQEQYAQLDWTHGVEPGHLSSKEYIKHMNMNIRKAVLEVISIIGEFITPRDPKETFTQYLGRCQTLTQSIQAHVIDSLSHHIAWCESQGEQERVHHRILVLTRKIVSDFYSKFLKVYQILVAHRNSANPTSANALVSQIKPHLAALTSLDTLRKLEKELAELEELLKNSELHDVAHDIGDLRGLVVKAQSSIKPLSTREEMELLNKIRRRLQKL